MRKQADKIYEYACHEGNYGMFGMLAAARGRRRSGSKEVSLPR
jgi:hypothetical protein